MADDKERAEKLAAARKKAQKKAAEAKAKKSKAGAPNKDEATPEPTTTERHQEERDAPAEEATPIISPALEAKPAPPAEGPAPAAPAGDSLAPSELPAALAARLASLEKDHAAAVSALDEAQLLANAREQKVASLETLHREDEAAMKRLETNLAAARTEAGDLRDKLKNTELKLSKKEAQDGGGTDNDHLDELEDEERRKLEGRIRELEAENTELKRGIWQDKRRDLQPSMEEATSFTNVDLGVMSPITQSKAAGVLGEFFTSGFNALTGQGQQQSHPRAYGQEQDEDGFLDDDSDFDEEAFRKAQEEIAKARIERIKEVKRELKSWDGWRLDLVEGRRGGGEGIGEIFEV